MKILYVTTIGGTMSFFGEHFKMLLKEDHEIELACNTTFPVRQNILDLGLKVYNIPFSRNPFVRDNIMAYKMLKKLITKNKYDIVHCHTPNAAAITRFVCRGLRKQGLKVIYTAHGFHFYKGAPIKNWLIYYPVEWICSYWTDVLITINSEDFGFAKKHMHAKKVEYVPGVGIDLDKFNHEETDKHLKRQELGIGDNDIVLLSVGELNENKNHEVVIKALARLQDESLLASIKYLICGQGKKKEELEQLIEQLSLKERVKLLGFRTDISEICSVVDVFVFPSFREGLSVALMEAMASGLPCVVSKIRGNTDLIEDGKGGFLFKPDSISDCKEAIINILNADKGKMGEHNKKQVKNFSEQVVVEKMRNIYGEMI